LIQENSHITKAQTKAAKISVAFHTLGCKLNFSETSSLGRSLRTQGFKQVPFQNKSDVYIINTCSVTDNADKKCRAVVRQALRVNPEGFVVIIGCYAQLKPAEIANIPGVDLVLGAAEKFNLPNILLELDGHIKKEKGEYLCGQIEEVSTFIPSWSSDDRTRTFLKVQDGCDYGCSFCTIPLARGASRSDTVQGIIDRVKTLAVEGTKEVVLTGINLGDFGWSGEKGIERQRVSSFFELIKELDKLEHIGRYRISSIEPNLLDPEIIDFVAKSSRFVPHFHIPLQSGNDRILGLMRRRYKKELYTARIKHIQKVMPHAAIGVDVIVGFPGETQEEFLETYTYLQELGVTYLHVFPYSERDNTLAVKMEHVIPRAERLQRSNQLRNLSSKLRRQFQDRFQGEIRPVLFEKKGSEEKQYIVGFTDNYLKVKLPWQEEFTSLTGNIVPVQIGQSLDNQSVIGTLIEREASNTNNTNLLHLSALKNNQRG
jgi:threonylcarbamoyladenosine tRNA methylthiotransferase MtaB